MKYTDNLKLFKYEPEKDGKQPFSIEKALNENWDKIDADRSAWARSLQGKANTDLSNLSDSGKKVVDGQWIQAYHELSTAKTKGTYNIDLSTYLPNDSYSYELSMYFFIKNTSNTGYTTASIKTEFYPEAMTFADVEGAYGRFQYSIFNVIVPSTRTFTLELKQNASSCILKMLAYRRIGTNT